MEISLSFFLTPYGVMLVVRYVYCLLFFCNFFFPLRNLYPKFASPWASSPCRPQDIGKKKMAI